MQISTDKRRNSDCIWKQNNNKAIKQALFAFFLIWHNKLAMKHKTSKMQHYKPQSHDSIIKRLFEYLARSQKPLTAQIHCVQNSQAESLRRGRIKVVQLVFIVLSEEKSFRLQPPAVCCVYLSLSDASTLIKQAPHPRLAKEWLLSMLLISSTKTWTARGLLGNTLNWPHFLTNL